MWLLGDSLNAQNFGEYSDMYLCQTLDSPPGRLIWLHTLDQNDIVGDMYMQRKQGYKEPTKL
jgi:hypothetical protein